MRGYDGAHPLFSGDRFSEEQVLSGFQWRLQNFLKSHGRIYYLLIKLFSPVFDHPSSQRKIRNLLKTYGEGSIILNLGSGPSHYMGREDIVNIDLSPYREVDIVADVLDLPIGSGTVDLIINVAMLEHVVDPKTVVDEMHRILKGGGKIICFLPFIQPFHAAPNDFQRWTREGIGRLFSCFDHVEISMGCGPTSGMLWVVQEWLSILLSFGSKTLHDIFFLVLMVCTAPIKIFDTFMVKLPYAEKIASGFYVIGQKRK